MNRFLVGAIALSFQIAFLVFSGPARAQTSTDAALQKITFDWLSLSQDGLRGTGDGAQSVRYEFCVPDQLRYREEVRELNPDLEVYPSSPGRIGCAEDEVLFIGETHRPQWQERLLAIARLDYITRIDESFGE